MSANKETFEAIGSYYDALVSEHGHHFRACDYGRAESQRLKFQVLSEVMALEGKSVLDIGCGFADFSDYLKSRYDRITYAGIDVSAEMVREASKLHPDLRIAHGNFLEAEHDPHDIVFANGIFYLLGEAAWPIMKRLIARMYETARVAIAFNSLSSWATTQEAGEFYAEPSKVLDYCRTLCSRVVLRHDYLPHDFTIYLYKDEG